MSFALYFVFVFVVVFCICICNCIDNCIDNCICNCICNDNCICNCIFIIFLIVFVIAFAIVFCNCICIWGNPTNEKQGELCLVFCICTLSFTPATMIVLMWVTNIRRVLNDRHYDPLIIHCGEV